MGELRLWRRSALLLAAVVAGLFLGHEIPMRWTVAALGGAIVGVIAAVAAAGVAHHRLVRRLRQSTEPATVAGIAVRVGPLDGAAFVAGLRRPTIYCDVGLLARLDQAERRAVLLHEQAHCLAHDPARLVFIGLCRPVSRLVPRGRAGMERMIAAREIAADRHALARGVSRATLASALVHGTAAPLPGVAGWRSALDLRLEALVNDTAPTSGLVGRPAVVGLIAGIGSCMLLTHGVCHFLLGLWPL